MVIIVLFVYTSLFNTDVTYENVISSFHLLYKLSYLRCRILVFVFLSETFFWQKRQNSFTGTYVGYSYLFEFDVENL